ncbi:four helix bundle protein [Opitutus terrae]|uniref:S23 ribosomal protein n=1 Tax=Opitutus terrae (strain DSM 11246 / JCM 15787 / PB90-1) TaxID=452637 RepID=B1ZV69_OPITP|nr:four helix bundle protein [Opitutus terrae]ACB76736.1 S23 ribosomal protein [Opitutus terrae PB90-1]
MPAPIHSFEDLECWKAGREVRLFVAKQVVPLLPISEKHRLSDQIIRAARSITANIAEGYGRFHHLENAKFCSIARGSACEGLDHLITGADGPPTCLIRATHIQGGREQMPGPSELLAEYATVTQRSR